MKKTISILLILVMVLVAGGIFYKKNTGDGDSHFSYQTDDYKIEYPSQFSLKQGDNPNFQTGNFLLPEKNSEAIDPMPVDITLILRKDGYSKTNLQDA